MHVYTSLKDARHIGHTTAIGSSAFCLGTFDGVHAGHRVVMDSALRAAKQHGLLSGIFTFSNHPQSLLTSTPPRLLSSFEDRLNAFEAMGFDVVVCPPFDEAMKNIKAQDFIDTILYNTLQCRSLSVGYDFCFGQNRQGNGAYLQHEGPKNGIEHIHVIEPVKVDGQIVSSTLIRKLLTYGELEQAVNLLGHPYILSAPIIQGKQLGRQLGFPTANMDMTTLKQHYRLIPANGVYGGFSIIDSTPYRATINIGHSPSVDGGTPQPRIEVHLLDYSGTDFYKQNLTLHLTHRLRDERRFDSLDALKMQIQSDCHRARLLLPPPHQQADLQVSH